MKASLTGSMFGMGGALIMIIALALMPRIAMAGDSVTINGISYTCTNSCSVTTHPDGSWTVRDCCGGQVTTRFYTHIQ